MGSISPLSATMYAQTAASRAPASGAIDMTVVAASLTHKVLTEQSQLMTDMLGGLGQHVNALA